jgi:hypothetical protein
MAKISKISFVSVVFVFLFLIVLFISSCANNVKSTSGIDNQMLELKKTACYSAVATENCMDKLSDSEVVTVEECCKLFEKCC